MKSLKLALISAAMLIVATTPAALAAHTSVYNQNGVRFSYPSNWQRVPQAYVHQLAQQLVSESKGIVKLGSAGAVDNQANNASQACVALLARMKFTPAYQKDLKGNHQKFLKAFQAGVKAKATKVLSTGTGSFAGQAHAFEMQALVKSQGQLTHTQIFVSIPTGNKSVDMGVFVVIPKSRWSRYASQIHSIAASSRFSG